MIRIPIQEHLEVIIQGTEGLKLSIREIKELFSDLLCKGYNIRKNEVIGFYNYTDHLYSYKFLESKKSKFNKSINTMIFKII